MILIVIFITITTCIIYLTYKKYDKYINQLPDPELSLSQIEIKPSEMKLRNCICVFDIDNTITGGNPKIFVQECIRHGCRLAINTARPAKYIDDVDIFNMGFKEPHYDDNDFFYNKNSYQQNMETVAIIKSIYLDVLADKYNIDNKKHIIFIDDSEKNIEIAKSRGYSTILVKGGGLGYHHLDDLYTIIKNFSQHSLN